MYCNTSGPQPQGTKGGDQSMSWEELVKTLKTLGQLEMAKPLMIVPIFILFPFVMDLVELDILPDPYISGLVWNSLQHDVLALYWATSLYLDGIQCPKKKGLPKVGLALTMNYQLMKNIS